MSGSRLRRRTLVAGGLDPAAGKQYSESLPLYTRPKETPPVPSKQQPKQQPKRTAKPKLKQLDKRDIAKISGGGNPIGTTKGDGGNDQ